MASSEADDELLAAAVSGNLSGVRRALQRGAALESRNAEGFTAVCIAAERGHASVVEVLCDAGLDPAQRGGGGWTPLMWAARNGHLECVAALCRRAAPTGNGGTSALDLDATNDNGSTAVMVAATCGHAAVIASLAEAGANLHVSTAHNGSTALHLASSCGNRAAAEQLLELDGSRTLLNSQTSHVRRAVAEPSARARGPLACLPRHAAPCTRPASAGLLPLSPSPVAAPLRRAAPRALARSLARSLTREPGYVCRARRRCT